MSNKQVVSSAGRAILAVADKSEFTYGVYPPHWHNVIGEGDVCRIDVAEDVMDLAIFKLGQGMMGATRSIIAKVDLLLQGIAYCPPVKVVQEDGKSRVKIGVYVRNRYNNEGQLSQKLSIGLGGHIEHPDVRVFVVKGELTGKLDLQDTLFRSALREIHEEANFGTTWEVALNNLPVGFVKDGAEFHEPGYVGNHHFGAIYPVQVRDGAEFNMVEKNNDAIGWFDAADLRLAEVQTGAKFEPWSQMIIKEILALSTDPQEISDRLIKLWKLDKNFQTGAPSTYAFLDSPDGFLDQVPPSPLFSQKANPNYYTPQVDEPSPFGPKSVNYKPNAWIRWHNESGKAYHEIKGIRYTGGGVVFLEEIIKSLESEPKGRWIGDEPAMQTSSGELSLGWVIWFYYCNAAESWEKAHAVGLARIAAL
jgi:predicted NUDIX family phosphoesterase